MRNTDTIMTKKLILSSIISLVGIFATTNSMSAASFNYKSYTISTEYSSNRGNAFYGVWGCPENAAFAFFTADNAISILSSNLEVIHSFSINLPQDAYIDTLEEYYYDTRDNGEILVTQHIFNNDDFYEVVVVEYEQVGPDPWDTVGKYYVYNEKGEKLFEIPETQFLLKDGNLYFLGSEYREKMIYLFGAVSDTNVRNIKSDVKNLSMTPNPVHADETIYLNLPEDIEAGCMISVLSIDGRILFSKTITDRNAQIIIPGYMVMEGINPVVVTDANGDVVAAGKILKN